jgi:hypothetical protein
MPLHLSTALLVGVAEIDRQHEELFRRQNDVLSSLSTEPRKRVINPPPPPYPHPARIGFGCGCGYGRGLLITFLLALGWEPGAGRRTE